jgi:hypothetical protein
MRAKRAAQQRRLLLNQQKKIKAAIMIKTIKTVLGCLTGKVNEDTFCIQQDVSSDALRFTVKTSKVVKVPIAPKQVRELIEHARPAKYGLKDKTLYNPTVRNVWEITAEDINIVSENWAGVLGNALEDLGFELNIPKGSSLEPHLHNMVIYGPGQFFAAHQDSEKMPGMVATLVVLLPSNFRGGSLVVDHHGRKLNFGRPKDNTISLIAFYADCHHLVEPVTSGYRIALTYNLVMTQPETVAPTNQEQDLIVALDQYFAKSDADNPRGYSRAIPKWFVFLLDHQYTSSSLSWSLLKGSDRHYVGKLLAAAEALNLEPYLALADIHESWEAESEDFYQRGRRRRDYSDDFNDVEDLKIIEGEQISDECTLNYWIDRAGRDVNFKAHYVTDSMLCWAKSTSKFDPFRSEYEGYQGNYGNTIDKWYHRAAIVLWPKDSHYKSLFSICHSMAYREVTILLEQDLHGGRKAVEQILDQVQASRSQDKESLVALFKIAHLAQDPNLAKRLTEKVRITSLCKSSHKHLIALFKQYGEKWMIQQVNTWEISAKSDGYGSSELPDFERLVEVFKPVSTALVTRFISYQLEEIKSGDHRDAKWSAKRLRGEEKTRLERCRSFIAVIGEADAWIAALLKHILSLPNVYDPVTLGKIAIEVRKVIPELSRYEATRDFIEEAKRSLSVVVESTPGSDDWSIRERLHCNCSDCNTLGAFLTDVSKQVFVWPLAEARRRHIHDTIDGMNIPVKHITKPEGSPRKLIITKTSALHKLRADLRDEASSLLAELRE